MPTIAPCLWFDEEAERAAKLYTELFPDSRITGTSRYPETFDTPANKPRGSVLTVEAELAGQPFTLLNGGPTFTPNPSVSFFLNFDPSQDPDARANLEATWEVLSEGGTALMPLDAYPFSELYGWIQDRFGISWQLMLTDPSGEPRPLIVPSLMFVGEVAGRAEEAIAFYTSVFEGSKRGIEARYGPDEPHDAEGTLMFADVQLAGQWFACMDSGHPGHAFAFNEGVSLQVLCEDQAAVDRYWQALTRAGGKAGPCGWLTDRFGVCWQVVPTRFVALLAESEAGQAGYERVFEAMLGMGKLDVEALEAAFAGRSAA